MYIFYIGIVLVPYFTALWSLVIAHPVVPFVSYFFVMDIGIWESWLAVKDHCQAGHQCPVSCVFILS